MPARRAIVPRADEEFKRLPTSLIDEPTNPSRTQMNEVKFAELVESIKTVGLINPLRVVPVGKRWEVVAGHRRLLACREARLMETPCLVSNNRDYARTAAQLAENIDREDLNPADEALWYSQLMEANQWNFEDLCFNLKKSQGYVGPRLRLLQGDETIFDDLREGRYVLGVANALNRVDDPQMRNYFRDLACQQSASVRTVEHWVTDWKRTQGLLPPQPVATPQEALAPVQIDDPMTCHFCGGNHDKYNLVPIFVHKYELTWIKEQLAKAQRME